MKLRFGMKIHHTSITGSLNAGCFVAEFEGSQLQSGKFHFEATGGEVAIAEDVERLVETTRLTKGLRLRNQQVRFVCVLKAHPKETADANDSENGDADDPYFCATIDSNGWGILKTIFSNDTQEVCTHGNGK